MLKENMLKIVKEKSECFAFFQTNYDRPKQNTKQTESVSVPVRFKADHEKYMIC